MIHIKYCKECNRAYDIGTNFDKCPVFRYKLDDETKKRDSKCTDKLNP